MNTNNYNFIVTQNLNPIAPMYTPGRYGIIRFFGLIVLTAFFTVSYAQRSIIRNAEPFWSPDGKKIVFTSMRDGQSDIYVMNSDGTDQKNLTHHPAGDSEPQWSPDGSKILFISNRTGTGRIFTMKPDGSEIMELTHTGVLEFTPAWSPSGKKIAYASTYKKNTLLYVTDADGSNSEQLTIASANLSSPIWSPDETKIACSVGHGEMFGSLIIDLASHSNEFVVGEQVPVKLIGWSADGGHSFYIESSVNGYGEKVGRIYCKDGNEKTITLTKRVPQPTDVEIAPDEIRVLYVSNDDVFVADPKMKKPVKAGMGYHSAKWSPDGKTIVMVSKMVSNIFTVKADGSELTQLTY